MLTPQALKFRVVQHLVAGFSLTLSLRDLYMFLFLFFLLRGHNVFCYPVTYNSVRFNLITWFQYFIPEEGTLRIYAPIDHSPESILDHIALFPLTI